MWEETQANVEQSTFIWGLQQRKKAQVKSRNEGKLEDLNGLEIPTAPAVVRGRCILVPAPV